MTGPVWMPMRTRNAGRPSARRLPVVGLQLLADGDRGADGGRGMPLQMVGRAEECHHPVAEELVDRTALGIDGVAQHGEMMVQQFRAGSPRPSAPTAR